MLTCAAGPRDDIAGFCGQVSKWGGGVWPQQNCRDHENNINCKRHNVYFAITIKEQSNNMQKNQTKSNKIHVNWGQTN